MTTNTIKEPKNDYEALVLALAHIAGDMGTDRGSA